MLRPLLVAILAVSVLSGTARLHAPAPVPVPAADDTPGTYKKLLETAGSALVTVKCILKFEGGPMGGGDEAGREMETTALMIEQGGLVLTSNAKMGGLGFRGVSITPTNIRVLVGDDTEGLKARILARDAELDLCWITIDDDKAKDKKFNFADFGAAAEAPTIGDRVYHVDRLGKFFDHAMAVHEGRIAGSTHKPRQLLIPVGIPQGRVGLALYTADAKVLGFNVYQAPDKEDVEGGESGGEGNSGVLLLPAAEVVKATGRAKETAAKTPKEGTPEEPKKDAEKKPEAKKEEAPKP